MKPRVRFMDEYCTRRWTRYENGRIALELYCENGEPMACCTTNLPDEPLPEGAAFIKDYSENAGMTAALHDAGVIEASPVRRVSAGFVSIEAYRLTPEAMAEFVEATTRGCDRCDGTGEEPGAPLDSDGIAICGDCNGSGEAAA